MLPFSYIDVLINGVTSAIALIDTGSAVSFISAEFALAMELLVDEEDPDVCHVDLKFANGRFFPAERFTVVSENRHEPPNQLTLGLEFFGRLSRITFHLCGLAPGLSARTATRALPSVRAELRGRVFPRALLDTGARDSRMGRA